MNEYDEHESQRRYQTDVAYRAVIDGYRVADDVHRSKFSGDFSRDDAVVRYDAGGEEIEREQWASLVVANAEEETSRVGLEGDFDAEADRLQSFLSSGWKIVSVAVLIRTDDETPGKRLLIVFESHPAAKDVDVAEMTRLSRAALFDVPH